MHGIEWMAELISLASGSGLAKQDPNLFEL
jgi:hypothetical protein